MEDIKKLITDCLQYAAAAEVRAEVMKEPMLKGEYLRIAEAWYLLAQSYDHRGQLEAVLLELRASEIAGMQDVNAHGEREYE